MCAYRHGIVDNPQSGAGEGEMQRGHWSGQGRGSGGGGRRWGSGGEARDTDAQLCGGATPIASLWVLTFKIALFSSDVDRLRSSGILLVARRSEALIMVTAMPVQKRNAVNQQHTVVLYPTGRRVSLHLARDIPYGSNLCIREVRIPRIRIRSRDPRKKSTLRQIRDMRIFATRSL
jgi:hypothetical protein